MRSGNFWRVLGLCLLVVGAWGQQDDNEESEESSSKKFDVSITGTTVMLTCPVDRDQVNWKFNDGDIPDKKEKILTKDDFSELKDSGYYTCYTDKENVYYLYLRARVCKDCLEVDLMTVVTIVIVDICITLGLLLVVYYWSKNRKAKAKPVTRATGTGSRPRGPNKERPPPVPNPDYEPIRKGQRDLYAGLNHRGI